jgi:hypothetical protein
MRIRSRSTSDGIFGGNTFTVFHQKLPGHSGPSGYDTESVQPFATRWVDEVISDDPTFSKKCKPVTHTKLQVEWPVNQLGHFYAYQWDEEKFVTSGTAPLWYYVGSGSNTSGPFVSNVSSLQSAITGATSPSVVWEKSAQQLYVSAVSQLFNTNKVQGLVDVIETEQSVNLVRELCHTASDLVSGRFWKIIKDVPNLYLAYQFGVKPLVADIKAVTKDIQKWPSLIKRLKDQREYLVSRSSCSGTLSLNTSAFPGYSSQVDPCDGSWWHGDLWVAPPPKRTLTVKALARHDISNSTLRAADGILSRWLANGPATTVWELVPFSFVVDWFVDTSAMMAELDNLLTYRSNDVVDAWVTDTYECGIPMIHHRRDNNSGFQYPEYHGVTIGNLKWSSYSRNPYSPDIDISTAGRFGKKQACLSAALLYQQVAKFKSRK